MEGSTPSVGPESALAWARVGLGRSVEWYTLCYCPIRARYVSVMNPFRVRSVSVSVLSHVSERFTVCLYLCVSVPCVCVRVRPCFPFRLLLSIILPQAIEA